MEVNIFTYDWTIILDDVYNYLNWHEWLFEDVLNKIKHLEDTNWKWSWKNFKSLKDWVWWVKWLDICEIKTNWIQKETIRIFYYYRYGQLVLILDWMSKPINYTSKKETKDVNKKYEEKINNCEYMIDNFLNWYYKEWVDYIKFRDYLNDF